MKSRLDNFRTAFSGVAMVLACMSTAALADTATRVTTYSYYGDGGPGDSASVKPGLVKMQIKDPGTPASCLSTAFGYDVFNNVTSAVDSNCSGASGLAVFQSQTRTATYGVFNVGSINVAAGVFPSERQISDGAASTTHLLKLQSQQDPRFGTPKSETAPDGRATTWVSDDFGRIVRKTNPDQTSVLTLYCVLASKGIDRSSNSSGCDALSFATSEVLADAVKVVHREVHDKNDVNTGSWERIYSDRAGRPIRMSKRAFDAATQPVGAGTVVVIDTIYNDQSVVIATTQPYFLASGSSSTKGSTPAGGTRIDYDALGRRSAVYVADPQGGAGNVSIGSLGSRVVAKIGYSYNGQVTVTTNDKGQQRTEEADARGNVVRVTDPTGAQLSRQFDAFGNLVSTLDALQNQISMTYDGWGRRLSMTDPDLGVVGFCYDAAGQLRARQDTRMRGSSALGACPATTGGSATTATKVTSWTTMAYDFAGRMTQRTEAEQISTWSFDNCATGQGKLCEATTTTGVDRTYAYDSLGRPSSSKLSVTGGPTWAFSADYDATTGHLAHQTWPTGLQVSYGYTPAGFLSGLNLVTAVTVNDTASPSALWVANSTDAWGHAEGATLANGVITATTVDSQGRVTDLTAGKGGGTAALGQHYAWDSLSRLSARSDDNGDGSTGAVSESFGYDDDNRLAQYTVSAPQIADFARVVTLQYNALGNLLYKSDVGDFTYPAAGGSLPHAMSAVGSTHYGYDASGNLTSATGGRYNSLAFSSFNQVLTAGGSGANYAWLYDDRHQRLMESRTDAHGTRKTWYGHPDNEGGLAFEFVEEADGSKSSRHFLSMGDETITLISAGSLPPLNADVAPTPRTSMSFVRLEYWHADALGSLASTTDVNGMPIARYAYDPFGKRRYTNGRYDIYGALVIDWADAGSTGTGRGFSAHEQMDDIGLTNMNGRLFDPLVGRFVQSDAFVPHPGDLQGFNRYSYCRNNPLNCVDPSGFDDNPLFPGSGSGSFAPLSESDLSYSWTNYAVPPQVPGGAHLTTNFNGAAVWAWTTWGGTDELVEVTGHTVLLSSFPNIIPPQIEASWAAGTNPSVGIRTSQLAVAGAGNNGSGGHSVWTAGRIIHTGLDALSVVPVVDIPAGIASGIWSAAEGDWTGSLLSFGAAVPFFGEASALAKLGRTATTAERFAKEAEAAAKACGCCFAAGTPVLMESGPLPIERVAVGMRVKSLDEATGEVAFKPVTALIRHDGRPMYRLLLKDAAGRRSQIEVSDNHLFWVLGQEWVASANLQPGMKVRGANGRPVRVVGMRSLHRTAATYNFAVADFHTFYVGRTPVLVHNGCPACKLASAAAGDAIYAWTSASVKSADKALSEGAASVTVKSRAEAEELFLGRYQADGYRNATGFDGVGTKDYFGSKGGTYHWDDIRGADGRVMNHGPNNVDGLLPHLQIAPIGGGSNIHIFFPW